MPKSIEFTDLRDIFRIREGLQVLQHQNKHLLELDLSEDVIEDLKKDLERVDNIIKRISDWIQGGD